ncbi:hypothetical protein Q7P37_011646 [Cladosporium fusiforme]
MSTQYVSKYLDRQRLENLLVDKFGKQDFKIECKRGVTSFFIPGGKDKELSEDDIMISNVKDVDSILTTNSHKNTSTEFASCMVCMHQNHSFQPINVTRDCLRALTTHLDISPEFLDTMSNFYQKVTNAEETYCAPLILQETTQIFEYMYILKYPEQNHRSDEESWSIRQTAVYHQLHKATGKSVFMILSPLEESAGEMALSSWFRDSYGLQGPTSHAFAVNRMVLDTYYAGWRGYMSFYEKKIEKLCMKMMSIGMVIVDAVTPDEMADLFYFESRLIPLSSAAAAAERLCEDLQQCSRRWPAQLRSTGPSAKIEEEDEWLENHRSKVSACSSHAIALLVKCERARQLLDRILNLKSQQIAQQQNTNILALTKSTVDDSATVRVMTAITLVYLSCTVVATVFSTPFFDLKDENKSLMVSPDFWIYAAVSAPLTIATITYWRWSLARKRRERQIAGVVDKVCMV